MTQPKFSPILPNDEVRELYRLAAPGPWLADRPADFRADPGAARKAGRGSAGPDQGYAMLLAQRFAGRLRLDAGENAPDVLHGAGVIAMRRAALYGRAPVSADLELALHLFGYLDGGSEEMLEARGSVFAGISHDYGRQRKLADMIPEATLHMTAAQVVEKLADDPSAFAELSGIAG